jgi:glyoxylase-like metal-dependent hydrolase (beta-lactamase superfamily II)
MLTGAGGNMGLSIGSDGAFLIDDQLAPLTQKIQAKVAALGAPGVRFVINTHWHGDHTGGNENLGTAGSLIFAHENVRARMSSEQFMAALDRRVPASPPAALPVVTFETSVTLHLNGDEIHVFHLDPAHTDGDSVVHFREANVVHSGDAYVAGMYPFIDISSGGRLDGIVAATDRILAIADAKTRIIPGHGPLSNREELEAWRAMLVDIRQRVRVAIAAGSPKDEVIASRPSADFDARYGGGFMQPDVFVGLVYESLSEP